jgi:hypothetical protein
LVFPPFRLNGYLVGNSTDAKLPVDINLMDGGTTLLLNDVLHDYVQRSVLVKHLLEDFAHEQFVALTAHWSGAVVGHGNMIRRN